VQAIVNHFFLKTVTRMYVPKLFEVTDIGVIETFISQNGFATLISKGGSYPVATHIPIELEMNEAGEKVLWGHVSKANPQWKLFSQDARVLVIFSSPIHHYISSSWYECPNAPTWNYMSVHVCGTIRIITGQKLWESVRRLTTKYERIATRPISLDTLPHSVQNQMAGLVGFEIIIEKIEAAFKLSQNRSNKDLVKIVNQLKELNTPQSKLMAEAVEKRHYEMEPNSGM